MAKFVKPPYISISGRYSEHTNATVNVDLVTHMEKTKFAWYPDNQGVPSLKFHPVKIEWIFKSLEDRDKTYDLIVNTKG